MSSSSTSIWSKARPPTITPDSQYTNMLISKKAIFNVPPGILEPPILPTDAVNKEYVDTHSTSIPGGINTDVQFNNLGVFGGSSNFTWNNGTNTLAALNMTVANPPTIPTAVANKAYVDAQTGGSPGLPFNSVQFNTAGLFAGSSDFVWDNTLKKLTVNGDVIANNHLSVSDVTLKSNITPLNERDSLKMISQIECYKYNLLNQQQDTYGVMAQQLEEIGLNHLVNQGTNNKSVAYIQFIPLLISCVQQLSTEKTTARKNERIRRRSAKNV